MRIPVSSARYKLAVLWFSGFVLIAAILVGQQAFGYYGEDADAAWGWLLPNIVPTLSLMVAVLVAAQRPKHPQNDRVDLAFFRLTFAVSTAYLALLLFTILVQPLAEADPLTLMDGSKLYLGPFQGLATGLLAAFFMSASDQPGAP